MKQITEYINNHQLGFSFDKIQTVSSEYIPTYSHSPKMELQYSDILAFAIKRIRFHERLSYDSKNFELNYNRLRSIGIEFCIPFKRLHSNDFEIVADQLSFYSLMMVTVGNDELKSKFIKNEKKLMLYRLRVSGLSITEIDDAFWPDLNLRNHLVSMYETTEGRGIFKLEFAKSLEFFDPRELNVKQGFSILSLDDVYKIVTFYFGEKLGKLLKRYSKNSHLPAIEALSSEFTLILKKQKEPMLTLNNFEEVYKRSFPPCMYRIYECLKKSGLLTFKAHFELALFLKGCGMDYYAQADFWKIAKDPSILNLKSVFGLDDKGKDYCPHSCVTMVSRECPKNVYQVQGCPFRYMAKSEIKLYLKKMNKVPRVSDLEVISAKVPDHPQIACRLFFDAIYKEKPLAKAGISHPVEYFLQSEKRIREKNCYK